MENHFINKKPMLDSVNGELKIVKDPNNEVIEELAG